VSHSKCFHHSLFFAFTDEVGLEQNRLNGTVSSNVCAAFDKARVDFWSDCGGSSPEISCPCCTTCCPLEGSCSS
jgi:hypothetical protein